MIFIPLGKLPLSRAAPAFFRWEAAQRRHYWHKERRHRRLCSRSRNGEWEISRQQDGGGEGNGESLWVRSSGNCQRLEAPRKDEGNFIRHLSRKYGRRQWWGSFHYFLKIFLKSSTQASWKLFLTTPGACLIIERGIGKPLMWFPCTHHILELIVGAMVQQRWPTGGPRDAIYTRFKNEWPELLTKMPDIIERGAEKVKIYYAIIFSCVHATL